MPERPVVLFIARRRALLGVSAFAAAALVLAAWAGAGRAGRAVPTGAFRGLVIAIDPGHGAIDAGAVGRSGVLEKNVTLAIGLKLGAFLERAGARAVLTRTADEDPGEKYHDQSVNPVRRDIFQRVEIIKASGADLAVSVHANAFPSGIWYGGQVFFDTRGLPDSKRLAEAIQLELVRVTGHTDRDISSVIDHYVLWNVGMPAVTVEVGFLTNPAEERRLATPEYQERVAWSIFLGLARYLGEGPVPGSGPARR